MNLTDIRHLFDYTEWANGLALKAAAELTEENLRRDFNIVIVRFWARSCIWLEQNGFGSSAGTGIRRRRKKPGRFGRMKRAPI